MRSPPALVAFDVDGTLLRGDTICECIARKLGRHDEMAAFERLTSRREIAAARREMLLWYQQHEMSALLACLSNGVSLAPGAREGLARLRRSGIRTALVSITWSFAVEWLARELGADHWIGTAWQGTEVVDFWPEDKVAWLEKLLGEFRLERESLIAVGDSAGDIPMLAFAGRSYFVGAVMPALPAHVQHRPAANIAALVDDIVDPANEVSAASS